MDKVAIVFGGMSTEHEVSIVSAQTIASGMNKDLHEIVMIGITKDGEWMKYNGNIADMTNGNWQDNATAISFDEFKKFDIIFPALHGKYGEDGTIQGLFEMIKIPYVGCGVLASSLAMDKIASKLTFKGCGIATTDFIMILRDEIKDHLNAILDDCEDKLIYPMFVKPANTGSSVGISKVRNRNELSEGIRLAAEYDHRILVEKGVVALEVETGVIGNDVPECASVGSIQPAKDFYDYEAKYGSSAGTVIQVPAKLDDKIIEEVRKTAIEAYKAMDCSGCARVDFLVEKETGKVYLNELNTLPGFTSLSMFPMIWADKGVELTELLDKLIEYGYERFEDKKNR